MHVSIEPAILYFGTPVVLVATLNEDGSANLAPISSIFWLGWRAVIGLNRASRTAENLARTGECVLNLPEDTQAPVVDRLACTTGASPVPPWKQAQGFRHVADKFVHAGLHAEASETVAAPRVRECPVQLEARRVASQALAADHPGLRGHLESIELQVRRVHVRPDLRLAGHENRIDPTCWRPLIMSFQRYFGLGAPRPEARLARVPEEAYRIPEVDPAG